MNLHDIEAEQVLLGGLLIENEAAAGAGLRAEHFYDAVHGRIFSAIQAARKDDRIASATTLRVVMSRDDGLGDLGGTEYLARLAGVGLPSHARDLSRVVIDLWARRTAHGALQAAQEALGDLSDGKGLEDALGPLEARLAAVQADASRRPMVKRWAAVLEEALQAASDAYQSEGRLGVATGVTALDELLGGLSPGNLMVLAGRPSMGKTAVALGMAVNVARSTGAEEAPRPVCFVSLEMTADELGQRFLSMMSAPTRRVAFTDLRRGTVSEEDFRHVATRAMEFDRLPIDIIDGDARELGRLRSAVAQAVRQRRPALIVVDYLQRIIVKEGNSTYERVTAAVGAMKALAVQHQVPVLLLSQLSREVEKRDPPIPQMSDLRDSGAIEEDADQAVFVYRPEYYLERMSPRGSAKIAEHADALDRVRGKVDLIVGKNRHGRIGKATARLDVATNWLRDEDAELQGGIFDG